MVPTEQGELFYKLTPSKVAELCALKYSEFKIFLYLKTLDPFGDSYRELDIDDLKRVTRIKSLGSIYPALAKLHALGLIDWYVSKSYVRVMDQCTDPEINTLIQRSAERSPDQPTDPEISPLKNSVLKVPAGKRFKRSKTLKTNKTSKKEIKKDASVSLEDDPEFNAWVDRGIDSLPKPPAGVYRQQLKRKELQSKANQQEFLQLRAARSRKGSNVPPQLNNSQKIEELPLDGEEYMRRLQARMLGATDG
jgi:hypothetical protein